VVKLAVAIRSLRTSDDSASPGFDSRPMHPFAFARGVVVPTAVYTSIRFVLLCFHISRMPKALSLQSVLQRRV
jgi:hypothetical protein